MNVSRLFLFWQFLSNKPLGRYLFNRLIRFINPYTGALKADILKLEKGYALIRLKDRRGIRNHLNSIHAIALTNLGEFASGIALVTQFSDNMRGIPVEINIEFLKKARGTLLAESRGQLPRFNHELEHRVSADIRDQENDIVARVQVKWKLGYKDEH